MEPLAKRYQADLLGVPSCYDRMIITGTLPCACYAGGMISFLNFRHIKIFCYAKVFADPWRERIRQCAQEDLDAKVVEQRANTTRRAEYAVNLKIELKGHAINNQSQYPGGSEPTDGHDHCGRD